MSRRIPLRATLLSFIMAIVLLAVFALTTFNYVRSTETAITIAEDFLGEVNAKTLAQVESLFQEVAAIVQAIPELPNLLDAHAFLAHPTVNFFIALLRSHAYIYSVYVGYEGDDFLQVISLGDNEALHRKLKAPEAARFAERRILSRADGSRAEYWRFLDNELETVSSYVLEETSYLPTARPWYQRAVATEGLITTDPYVYVSSRSLGLTMAQRLDGPVQGVVGIDLTLQALSRFLAEQKIGESGFAFLFNGQGFLLAHPQPGLAVAERGPEGRKQLGPSWMPELDAPLINAVFTRYQSMQGEAGTLRFSVEGDKYIAKVNPVPNDYLSQGYVAVVAPIHDFTSGLDKTRRDTLLFALAALALTIPMVVFLSRQISSNLLKLSNEANKVSKFDLEGSLGIHSSIKEVNVLAEAMDSMKRALRTFGQYVPQTLVKRIVTGELSPRLGGESLPLTILFTDVANFTSISEAMSAKELMLQVSSYLQTLGSTIIDHNGTIDKFIGDAVMAFWNAPTRDPEHVSRACSAALAAARAINEQNDEWRRQGKPVFHTRFGLHTGDCIVGNVGSADRMDYTAMGDTVNTASRLEGLNKYYRTQILVSREVRERAGDGFVFRPAGKVAPKGKAQPTDIFELIGLTQDADVAYAQQWSQAYEMFMRREFAGAAGAFARLSQERPDDELAAIYLDLAETYASSPPGPEWSGVERFTSK